MRCWRGIVIRLVTAAAVGGVAASQSRAWAAGSLNTVREIDAALRSCWAPPADLSPYNVQVTVRLSLKRNGEVLGEPLVAYENPGTSDDQRAVIRAAVAATLQRCGPLPLSAELGDIIAGHPITVRFGEGSRRKDRAGGSP
jgi:hypothetical protein